METITNKVSCRYRVYLGSDVVNDEIDSEGTHDFEAHTFIKNTSGNIDNIFNTMIKNYGSPHKGIYHTEVETYVMIVGDEVSRCRIIFCC